MKKQPSVPVEMKPIARRRAETRTSVIMRTWANVRSPRPNALPSTVSANRKTPDKAARLLHAVRRGRTTTGRSVLQYRLEHLQMQGVHGLTIGRKLGDLLARPNESVCRKMTGGWVTTIATSGGRISTSGGHGSIGLFGAGSQNTVSARSWWSTPDGQSVATE